jgi:tetratricopeptide (TPR) repeat protein
MVTLPPLGREAIEHARRGDIGQAIEVASQAVAAHPRDLGLRVFIGMLHARQMQLREALPHFRAATAIDPTDPFPRLELVRVLIGLGELENAGALLDERSLPGSEPLRLRAMLLHRRGEAASAARLYQQLVEADPRDFESWGNLGRCLIATDRPVDAIAALERALSLRPDLVSYWYKWAEAHMAAGSGEKALDKATELAGRNLADPAPCLAQAHLETLLGRPEQALAAVREALGRDGSNTDALVALADLLERQNSLDEFEATLNRLANLPVAPDRLPLLEARLEYRCGNYERALDLARRAPPATDAGERAQLIGQCLDKLGDAQGAFDAFLEMNREDSRSGGAVESKPEQYRLGLARQRRLLTRKWMASWPDAGPAPERQPAFLLGFPRSGTTLIDTLLMGHPKVAVAEEEPMLQTVGKALGDLERLATRSKEEVEELRRLYWQVADDHVPDAEQRLLVDKYPFGIGAAAIIHRLFPTARIAVVERHPCDVVLSCFMTRFQPTDAATNFLSLQDTAQLYDVMMRIWTVSRELLPLDVHVVRYERLVADTESELRSLTEFFGLEWLPQLLEHRKTARKRAFINTPSYAQVIEPVNAKAVGRWQRYRPQMEPVLPILEPWARRMGYEL